jgi:hypothetical protein
MVFERGLDPAKNSAGGKTGYLLKSLKSEHSLASSINGILFLLIGSRLNPIPILSNITKTFADPDHFSPNYRTTPKDNSYADREITKSHLAANRILEANNVELYNATIGGNLEVYDRVDLINITN